MNSRYLIAAAAAIIMVAAFYVWQFHNYVIVADTAVWGSFGDYFGGLINPILSFINLTLLIKSLSLTKDQLRSNEKSEKLKNLSTLFFNMIDSQKTLLDKLTIAFNINGVVMVKEGVDAVMELETEIEQKRKNGATDDDLKNFVDQLDASDKIFGILRAFYVLVKLISERLSIKEGFLPSDRRDFYLSLINFTDLSQLQLVIIGAQFIECPASDYLKSEPEFVDILKEVKLKVDPY